MALLAPKFACYVALVIVCCILSMSILIFSQEQQKRVLNHERSVQNILGPHRDDSNQHPGKSTSREGTMNEEHLGIHKVLSASVERSTSRVRGQEFKSTKHQAGSARHNLGDDDFWNMSYEERSKFQRRQIDEYCQRYTKQNKILPASQLLLHKEQKVALCYVPKSAGTTFKILLLHSQGMLPDQYLDYNKYKQPYFGGQLRKIFLNTLDSEEQGAVIRDYFKFIMLRHPLERLLSGYRSKMSVAVRSKEKMTDENNRDVEGDIFLFDKELIIFHAHPDTYLKWKAAHESYPVNITFSDFINYWVKSERLSQDAHFNSVLRLCRPCTVRYDYYGNFKTFRSDSKLLMDRIGASEDELRPQYPKPSDELVNKYYGQLTEDQKLKILRKLAPELRFYYMLFPPEKDTHKHILGIDADID